MLLESITIPSFQTHFSYASFSCQFFLLKKSPLQVCEDVMKLNLLTGKPLKDLPDLLREYNLPPGLFPRNITCYEFDQLKAKLIVYFPSACEVTFKDSSVVRYATRVKGTLSRGKLTGIEGMKTKVLVWVKVTSVTVESYKSDKVLFTAGVKKSRAKDAYEIPSNAIKVEEF
ncbi:hypothetical protein I3760_11G047100 [Carya illinoinensis]|uniref:DUF538 family protein n=1 Tax=Carya illinoinensis TaxID=32201 RepID=A0A922DM08_CARIL|nr:hypothetical protein I3760_11G047100 [Carya illinoinensis]KAG6686954.1 hypothetical protein I3842_11G047500 [Carya illinoinensis]